MVKGLKSLDRKLRVTIPKRVKVNARTAVRISAEKVVDSAEGFVPQDEGNLANSIGWVWGDKAPKGSFTIGASRSDVDPDLIATVFAGDETTIVRNKTGGEFQNARLQEFGTKDGKNKKAQPYFFPAYRLNKRANASRITRAIKKGLKEGSR